MRARDFRISVEFDEETLICDKEFLFEIDFYYHFKVKIDDFSLILTKIMAVFLLVELCRSPFS